MATVTQPPEETAATRPPLGPMHIRTAQSPAPVEKAAPAPKQAGKEWEESLAGRFWWTVESAQRNPTTYVAVAVLVAVGLAAVLFAVLRG